VTPPAAPDRLFELPRRMSRDTVHLTLAELRTRFERQYGQPVDDLFADLEVMRDLLFNPVAREERLRQTLARLAEQDRSGPPPDHIPTLLLMPAMDNLWIITPEGRVAIPYLERTLTDSVGEWCYVDDVDIHAAEHVALEVTRDWSRHRLRRTLELQAGAGGRMLPVAIAIPLLLTVNGNIGAEKAMRQPKDPADQDALDRAVTEPVRRFAEVISRKRHDFSDRHLALYNGYALSEARRRLGDDLRLDRVDANGAQHHPRKALYIADGREDAVLGFLGRELKARGTSPDVAAAAVQELIDAYQRARPTLAAFGVVHEDPRHTDLVRDKLMAPLVD
jgi:hypothetical protein